MLADPPERRPLLHEVLAGTTTYGALAIQPMLMLPHATVERGAAAGQDHPAPLRPGLDADESDFDRVFGSEADDRFEIGRPLDMDVPVCLDLSGFVERSNGIFGKTGTGKSFLTRLLLCGTIRAASPST